MGFLFPQSCGWRLSSWGRDPSMDAGTLRIGRPSAKSRQ